MAKKDTAITVSNTAPVTSSDARGFLAPFTAQVLEQAAAEGFSTAKVCSLDEGQCVRGTYEGPGPKVDVVDAATGEYREVQTHRIKVAPGFFLDVMGGAQLDRELPLLRVGSPVIIGKNGKVETSRGRRVNDFTISYPPDALIAHRSSGNGSPG